MMRLLIVDDEDLTLKLLEKITSAAGHQTRVAQDGALGLQAIEQFAPDIILSDVEMPNMNGLELLEAVRKRNTGVIFIVMTSTGSAEYAVQALRLSANDFLRKPIDPKGLLQILDKYALSFQNREATHKIAGSVVSRGLTIRVENTLQEIYAIADYILQEAGDSLAQEDYLGSRLGLAELLANAIEHGNLGITYEEESTALEQNEFVNLLRERLSNPELAARRVTLDFKKDQSGCEWIISDEGQGFNWQESPVVFDGESLLSSRRKSG